MRAAAHEMTRGIFVTGTDTGVGKTVVAAALLRTLVGAGYRAIGMKPVAAGLAAGETVHADARALIDAGNVTAPLADVKPVCIRAADRPRACRPGQRRDDRPRSHRRRLFASRRDRRRDRRRGRRGSAGPSVALSGHARHTGAPGAAGAARRRHPARLPQSCAAVGARHCRARASSRGVGGEPDRSGHDRKRCERRGAGRSPARAPLRGFRVARDNVHAFAVDRAALRELGFDSASKD